MQTKYESFRDFPETLQKRVSKVASPDEEDWVKQSIPALKGKSFLEQINEKGGYAKVCEYLTKIEGYFG